LKFDILIANRLCIADAQFCQNQMLFVKVTQTNTGVSYVTPHQ